MNKNDLQHFKDILLKEKAILEEELSSVGQEDTENPNDGWSATSGSIETDSADENEVADKFEELEENKIILSKLAPQYKDVKEALERIEEGTYGICEISGEVIEKERLEANPSAKTCKKHM
jgi:RNA polymerase-binding transcription factor DksA